MAHRAAPHRDGAAPTTVTHLIAPVAFGGGEALLVDLLGDRRDGLRQAVVTVGDAPALREQLEVLGVRCTPLGDDVVGQERRGRARELAGATPLVRGLRRRLADDRPDIVHAHGFPPSLLAAVGSPRGTRLVYTHHYERRPPGRPEAFALTRLFGRYDALTTPADHLTAAMNGHFPKLRRPFRTLRNGIDDAFAHGRPDARWRRLLPPDAAVGVCVGRLVATKNQVAVVSALAGMPVDARRRLGVLLVGSGPDEAALRSEIEAADLADRIVLAGQVPRSDMPDLLASADFALFPTLTEASSLAAAEALAAGLPIVGLDIPATRETVGDAGILTDAAGLGAALAEMADRHRELAPIARARGALSAMSTVRREWESLYSALAVGTA